MDQFRACMYMLIGKSEEDGKPDLFERLIQPISAKVVDARFVEPKQQIVSIQNFAWIVQRIEIRGLGLLPREERAHLPFLVRTQPFEVSKNGRPGLQPSGPHQFVIRHYPEARLERGSPGSEEPFCGMFPITIGHKIVDHSFVDFSNDELPALRPFNRYCARWPRTNRAQPALPREEGERVHGPGIFLSDSRLIEASRKRWESPGDSLSTGFWVCVIRSQHRSSSPVRRDRLRVILPTFVPARGAKP